MLTGPGPAARLNCSINIGGAPYRRRQQLPSQITPRAPWSSPCQPVRLSFSQPVCFTAEVWSVTGHLPSHSWEAHILQQRPSGPIIPCGPAGGIVQCIPPAAGTQNLQEPPRHPLLAQVVPFPEPAPIFCHNGACQANPHQGPPSGLHRPPSPANGLNNSDPIEIIARPMGSLSKIAEFECSKSCFHLFRLVTTLPYPC